MDMTYEKLTRELYLTGMVSDPWIAGQPRFSPEPVWLASGLYAEMARVAGMAGQVLEEMAVLIDSQPELTTGYFNLTPWQRMMWLAASGRWHGIARVDLFRCRGGRWQVCEVNSDTPSGEAEAVLLNRIVGGATPTVVGRGAPIDPNAALESRFWSMLVEMVRAAGLGEAGPIRVAILYPTDQPEDLSLVALYRQWLEARGCRVVLGSPYNLGVNRAGRVTLLGEPVELVLRHYKTDWWGEREAIWRDQAAYPDPDPLERELSLLLAAEREGRVVVVNPFGAVVTQNKLALAFLWDHQERFSPAAREWIATCLPETRRVVDLDLPALRREEWVLKSIYGCEGDSVIVGPFVSPEIWQQTIAQLIPEHWVAQRYFEVEPFVAAGEVNRQYDGWLPNYGIYLVAGQPTGIYTRLSRQVTDHTAVTVPTFVCNESS
jgi:glutathionylspermidine synthase